MSIFHEGHPNAFCISDGRKQGRKLSKGSSISWGVKLVNLCCKMSYEWPPCLIQNPLSWLRFLFHIHESPNIPIGFLPTCWNIFLGYASESFKVYLHHQEDDLSLGKPWRRLFRWKALVDILKICNWMIRFAISYRMTNKCFCPKWCKSKFIDGVTSRYPTRSHHVVA